MNDIEPARGVIRARRGITASKNRSELQKSFQVVGTIPSPAALACALRLKPGAVDLFELRVDHFSADTRALSRAIPKLSAPLIVTVRHPREGGAGRLSLARRRELYAEFLPAAKFIDIELRSATQLATTIADARARGVRLILSTHFFKSMPRLSHLESLRDLAFEFGADIFKIATLTRTMVEVLTLAILVADSPRRRLSAMGMGPLGKLSRPLLACAGSALNYGFLDTVQVPGQWQAPLLKERLAEYF